LDERTPALWLISAPKQNYSDENVVPLNRGGRNFPSLREGGADLRTKTFRVPTLCCLQEGNTLDRVIGERPSGTAESENLSMSENSKRERKKAGQVRFRVPRCP
jgi:hypothetical protein